MKYCFFISILFTSSVLFADAPQKYSQIRIFISDRTALDRVWKTGIDFEGSSGKPGGWMDFVAGPYERRELVKQGISFTIVHDDLSAKSLQGLSPVPANTLGFGYGSMGGYYTFAEVLLQLDSMKLLYPNLVRMRDSIGNSNEGRGMWAVKISDNPDSDEPEEPEVLYTSLHHAREPEGMMTVMYYMWWLLEHYGTDPTATYLINNRQMWFIPVVNPDGYVYNQTTNPGGGGFWRKNRRINGGGSFGVDPNRNYGSSEMWNAPNGGSSTNPGSDTYRGTAPFSEPENLTLAIFLNSHNIKTCLNYHTFGNYLIYPWGYLSAESGDSLIFREFAFDMVRTNRHTSGTDQQTVSYSTRGNSDDYMYGDLSKPQTFALTPEVGDSFWPSTSEIFPLAQKNLEPNIYYSYVAGQYAVLNHFEVLDGNNDGALTSGEPFSMKALIHNKGIGEATNLQATISCNSSSLYFTTSSTLIPTLSARSDQEVTFTGSVQQFGPLGVPLQIIITLTTPDGYLRRDTTSVIVGEPIILLADSGNVGTINWNTGTGWNTTGYSHTPPFAFTDSPTGNYSPSSNNSLTSAVPLDLDGYGHCVLKFWTKWAIEPTWDFAIVEVSTNGGISWIPLHSKLSHESSGRGMQLGIPWGYDGYTPGLDWFEQEIDLSSFIGQEQVLLRFNLASDGGDQRDGWYLDDIRVLAFNSTLQFSSITITDNGSTTDQLFFGESLFGTDDLDPFLQESELGPKPPSGTFDVRWDITATNGTKLDLRDTVASSSSTNIFTAEFQPGVGGYPITLRWDARGFLSGGWKLRDGLTHGTLFNNNMWADTSITINNSSIQSVEIVHSLEDSVFDTLGMGWHMVSVPMVVNNKLKSFLYPGAVSNAFAYEGNYVIKDTLENHKGYWIKYSTQANITLTGIPIVEDTLIIPSGWSLVGGVSIPLTLSQIQCNPPSNIFTYGNGGYSNFATSLKPLYPGEGFWIKGPTTAILSPFLLSAVAFPKYDTTELSNTLTITDPFGNSSTLTFGMGSRDQDLQTFPELPPLPPAGSFDVRFSSQRTGEYFSPTIEKPQSSAILLQSSSYPLIIEWNIPSSGSSRFELAENSVEKNNVLQSLIGHGTMQIANSATTSLLLRSVASPLLPKAFALGQNYPNPFNPSTQIQFDLPIASTVSVSVFNILGQTVQNVVEPQLYPAGRFNASIDGTLLSAGTYFYRLNAVPANNTGVQSITKKMTLIK